MIEFLPRAKTGPDGRFDFTVRPDEFKTRRPGVIITEVAAGSVSDELELRPNDRIVRVNGATVTLLSRRAAELRVTTRTGRRTVSVSAHHSSP